MNIKTRLKKLEKINVKSMVLSVADELTRLKALALSDNAPPPQTVKDIEQLIAECDDEKICKLHRETIEAITYSTMMEKKYNERTNRTN